MTRQAIQDRIAELNRDIEVLQGRLNEIDAAELAERDFKRGYQDRKNGVYDKWFRYNRADDGEAYTRGCMACVTAGDIATVEFNLIEVDHA